MAVSDSRRLEPYERIDHIFEHFFRQAIEENRKFCKLDSVTTVCNWYQKTNEFSQAVRGGKRSVAEYVANKIVGKLLKDIDTYYLQNLLNLIGFKTKFKHGAVEVDFRTPLASVRLFTRFIKEANQNDICSVNLRFSLNMATFISKLRVKYTQNNRAIEIERLGIDLALVLEEVTILYCDTMKQELSLDRPINLAHKQFEIKDLVLR